MLIEAESPEEMGYDNIRYNLAESSVRDITLQQLNIELPELLLCYGPHKGDDKLREAIISDQPGLSKGHVLLTPGAAGALFFIATTLLQKDDHMVVIRPNYATNIETPRALGCDISFVDLRFEEDFQLNPEEIGEALKPHTKLISITTPHNPTGMIIPDTVIHQVLEMARSVGARLLVDETYRELNLLGNPLPYAASIDSNIISVASLSKAYGVPGIRLGWVICKDRVLMQQLLAAKEQIMICGSVADEAIAMEVLKQRSSLLDKHLSMAKVNLQTFREWMLKQAYLEWVEPQGGVVAFPRIREAFSRVSTRLYGHLFAQYGTVVGPGHWFEQDDRYMRIGFGYPMPDEFEQGLNNIIHAIEDLL
jgi:aspartate/methionine/tyrosine aminotransferase